jgi:hypothetical protein
MNNMPHRGQRWVQQVSVGCPISCGGREDEPSYHTTANDSARLNQLHSTSGLLHERHMHVVAPQVTLP